MTESQQRALLHAVNKISPDISYGNANEISNLREILRAVIDPNHPTSRAFIGYALWDIEDEEREKAES